MKWAYLAVFCCSAAAVVLRRNDALGCRPAHQLAILAFAASTLSASNPGPCFRFGESSASS